MALTVDLVDHRSRIVVMTMATERHKSSSQSRTAIGVFEAARRLKIHLREVSKSFLSEPLVHT